MNPVQLAAGAGLAAFIAFIAYAGGTLSRSGAAAAFLVGALTFGFGGLLPAMLLIAFFVSSSLLSRFGSRRKQALAEKFAKGSTRDAAQVAANGSAAAVMAVLLGLRGDGIWLVALLGALAAATADTWATELGVLARSQPRLVTDGRPVEPGTSGAVTIEGTVAAGAGSLFLGGLAAVYQAAPSLALAGLLGGLGGAFVDSLLGASVQARYLCQSCGRPTEHSPRHTCGAATDFAGGWRWLTNDAVNAAASLAGAALAILVFRLFG
ncbi:MAG: DUF92 domain-containing protein [Anaerolineales bacterium]